jgi:hypothetical protein
MDTVTITEIMRQAQALSAQERKKLIKLLIDSLEVRDSQEKRHSILELAGLGKEIWEGIDAQEYVDQLRNEWDDRP